MLDALLIILLCQLAGETLTQLLALPIPGPVCGMVLLFTLFAVRGRIPETIARAGDALLSNLSLMFVPAGVGIILHGGLVGREWLAISLGIVVSTLITIAVTAWLMARLAPEAEQATPPEDARGDEA